jgi:hypothetical protein
VEQAESVDLRKARESDTNAAEARVISLEKEDAQPAR